METVVMVVASSQFDVGSSMLNVGRSAPCGPQPGGAVAKSLGDAEGTERPTFNIQRPTSNEE
jgi:hypothetical protein